MWARRKGEMENSICQRLYSLLISPGYVCVCVCVCVWAGYPDASRQSSTLKSTIETLHIGVKSAASQPVGSPGSFRFLQETH